MTLKSVLTADLVGSSLWTPEMRLRLGQELKAYLSGLQPSFPLQFEWYRGDSFQCLVHHPAHGVRLMLLLTCWVKSRSLFYPELKNPEVRISLGTGPVSLLSNELSSSHGEAFERSGRGLDQIKNSKLRLAISVTGTETKHWETIGILLDALLSDSTPAQCLVVLLKLEGKTEMQIGDLLNVSQSAINQRSAAAHYAALEASVQLFESQFQSNDSKSDV
jgi:hypothetical protein